MRAAGIPAKWGDAERGTPTATQHSKGLAQSSEQQPLHLVGCQPSNTLGARASPPFKKPPMPGQSQTYGAAVL